MKNYLDKLLLILVNNWRKHQIKRVVLQQEIPGIEARNKEELVCVSKDFVSKNFTQLPLQIDLEIIKNIFIRLDEDERFFEFTRFQAGGLDDEIVVIYFLMQLAKSQKILEIGVANGYSSAFLGDHAVRNNATYFQIDLPRFETTPKGIFDKIVAYLASKGLIVNRRNITDLKIGGVIPNGKYHGWMMGREVLNYYKRNMIIGDVFEVLPFVDEKFDFILIDAFKDRDQRLRLLEDVRSKATDEHVIALDGAWMNDAMETFSEQYDYNFYEFGKIQFITTKGIVL